MDLWFSVNSQSEIRSQQRQKTFKVRLILDVPEHADDLIVAIISSSLLKFSTSTTGPSPAINSRVPESMFGPIPTATVLTCFSCQKTRVVVQNTLQFKMKTDLVAWVTGICLQTVSW